MPPPRQTRVLRGVSAHQDCSGVRRLWHGAVQRLPKGLLTFSSVLFLFSDPQACEKKTVLAPPSGQKLPSTSLGCFLQRW